MEINEKRMKELKGKKFKLNLKRCGIFIRYTLPTALFVLGSGLGVVKIADSIPIKSDNVVTEYTSDEDTVMDAMPEQVTTIVNSTEPDNVADDSLTNSSNVDISDLTLPFALLYGAGLYLHKYILWYCAYGIFNLVDDETYLKYQFPHPLFNNLDIVNSEINAVKNEEKQLRLAMKK